MWLPFLFLYEHILQGRQLGNYFPNQVASSKILGAMATKMPGGRGGGGLPYETDGDARHLA